MPMTLRSLIENLSELDRSSSIYVEEGRSLDATSKVQLVNIPDEAQMPPVVPGMRCFMDVWQVGEVLSGKARLQGLDAPTIDQQLAMLLSFARHGA